MSKRDYSKSVDIILDTVAKGTGQPIKLTDFQRIAFVGALAMLLSSEFTAGYNQAKETHGKKGQQ